MPSNLTGSAMLLCNVMGDANGPALYFITLAAYQSFILNYYTTSTMDYYDNTGAYVGEVTLLNTGSYAQTPVNLPVSIDPTGLYHTIIMSTGSWNITNDDLNTITAAVSAAGGPMGLVETTGAVPLGLQNNYPTYTNGVTLTGVQPQTVNLGQVCNIIENEYQLGQV